MSRAAYRSPLGQIVLRAEGEYLTDLYFSEEEITEEISATIDEAKNWLDIYFSGKQPDSIPKIKMQGSIFQKRVWQLLTEISYGQTVSYSMLAEIIAKERGIEKMSARAVGNAAGKNPILIMVPCHRLVGKNGSLTGFAAGIERKRELLRIEKILLP